MIEIKHKADCSGCHACFSVCPKNCIEMKTDEEGFLYPSVNKELCVDCGMCEKVCQSKSPLKSENEPKAYACINKDEEIRMQSSSGGVFTLLAENIIERGGVVFGAAFDDDFSVKHCFVQEKEELSKFRGSKYVQSTIGNSYIKAKEFLDDGRYVLFTGTPCQTDGLLQFLKKDYENLYVQDIICHGVPSPMVWRKYLRHITSRLDIKVKEISFRNKNSGWQKYSVLFSSLDGGNCLIPSAEDNYIKAFLRDISLRPSCYGCHSKTIQRNSDITLADFWGVDKVEPTMYDDKGTSLVLVHSQKGREMFDEIKHGMIYKETDLAEALKYNPSAFKSVQKPATREKFLKKVDENNFDVVVRKYVKVSFLRRCIRKAKRIAKKVLGR